MTKKQTKKSKRENVTEADLLDAVRHVVYEYSNLVSAQMPRVVEPPINTHLQDAFLLSCRKMADFFTGTPQKHDLNANDYTEKSQMYRLPTWEKWAEAIDKQLAHITWKRDKSWDGSANKPFMAELRAAWKLFLSKLDSKYRDRFRDEISKKKQGPGFERLDLGSV